MKAYHSKLRLFLKIEFVILTIMLLVRDWEKYTKLNFILTLWARESKFHPFLVVIFRHDCELPEMNWLSHIFFTAEKFMKNNSNHWNSEEQVGCPDGNSWGQTFNSGDILCNPPTGFQLKVNMRSENLSDIQILLD